MRLRLLIVGVFALLLVGCDHATKELALSTFRSEPLSLMAGVLTLTYTENRDMAFGLLGSVVDTTTRLWLLTIVKSFAVIGGAVYFAARARSASWLELSAVTLVVAGAAGNLFDRITRGYVIDFLRLPHWPVFNVADIAIALGYGLLILSFSARRRVPQVSGDERRLSRLP